MLKRLRIKFVCIFMVIVTLMLCIILGTVIHLTQNNIEQQSISTLRNAADSVLKPGRPGDIFDPVNKPVLTLIMMPDGEIIADGDEYYDISDTESIKELYSYAESCKEESDIVPNTSLRFLRRTAPMGTSYIFTDISSELSTLKSLYKVCAVIGVGALLLFLLVSIFLAKWAIKPVEEAWDRQKQFIADASHELKTPLTVIMTNAELLQSDENEESKAKFSNNILTMSKQMRGLVESLLELARIDSGNVKQSMSVFDLSTVTADAVLPFEALFFEKEQQFTSSIEPGINIKGNLQHIRQLTDILLDNANKYSPTGSCINLKLCKTGKKQCTLSVSNEGEAISKEDLSNIFKRFYRGDKTRKMNHSYGLGLSIAENIAKEHSGKIWAQSANGVNTFTVQLPTE